MTTENKIVLRVVSILPFVLCWFLVLEKNQSIVNFWSLIGIDITKKYDFFLFVDFKQHLKWYIHYTAYYYALIVLSYSLFTLSRKHFSINASVVLKVFYLTCWFRLIEYWLFRFHLGLTFLIASILVFTLYSLSYRQKWRKYWYLKNYLFNSSYWIFTDNWADCTKSSP